MALLVFNCAPIIFLKREWSIFIFFKKIMVIFSPSEITLGYLIIGYNDVFFGNSDFAAAKFGNMSNRFDMI